MAAIPRAVSSIWRGREETAPSGSFPPSLRASAASERRSASSTVSATARDTSGRAFSIMAMSFGAADCASRLTAVWPRWPSSSRSWSSSSRAR